MKGLDRIVVFDFSKLLPGPFCTMLLADLGCRVVRVELPHWKDPLRDIGPKIGPHGFCYWMVNRNKESLCLDFRRKEGLAALLRLLKRVDVLVEGFRPGLMARLGLGPGKLRRRFPRLVYCSITGYGQAGPMSRAAGHDINFLAQSGVMGLGDSSGGVSFPGVQFADLSGSMYAALAVLAALHERSRTGRGRHVDISMAETIFTWQVLALGEYFAAGTVAEPKGRWWTGGNPFYRPYRTRDGRYIAVGALERGFAVNLLDAIGRPELDLGARGGYAFGNEETARAMEETFGRKTLEEWTRILEGKDVCATPVWTLDEALRHPFFRSRGTVSRKTLRSGPADTARKAYAFVASPMRFSRSMTGVRRLPPELGRDGAGVLRSLGLPAAEVRRLREGGLLSVPDSGHAARPARRRNDSPG